MGRSPKHRALAVPAALALCLSIIPIASAQGNGDKVTVVASGLDNPRGIDVGWGGRVFVAEAGTGKIVSIRKGQVQTVVERLPILYTPPEVSGAVNVDAHGGRLMIVVGGGPEEIDFRFNSLFRADGSGSSVVADIRDHRIANPQPSCGTGNPIRWCDTESPPNPLDSNAYGLAALSFGRALVTDAGGNDLVLVKQDGSVVTVARFPNRLVSTAHLPPAAGLPPMFPAEPVPTSVTVGPDGFWYVGELTGFPFTPGASRIWRIAPWARNVTCSEANPSRACRLYADGFTSIIDLDFGPGRVLYVGEIVKSGVGNLFGGTDVMGAVWRIKHGRKKELAAGKLPMVGGVAATGSGVYVTIGSVTGDGQVVKIKD